MGAKWNKWDWDYLWHYLGGAAINIPIMFWLKDWLVLLIISILITVGGIIREEIQHDWELLTAHQWLEGIAWGLGAVTVIPFVFLM